MKITISKEERTNLLKQGYTNKQINEAVKMARHNAEYYVYETLWENQ